MARGAAGEKVSSTVELLETILLHLSLRDLLLAQRVKKTFHETIQGSARMKCALFLTPSSSRKIEHFDYLDDLDSDDGACGLTMTRADGSRWQYIDNGEFCKPVLNPFLFGSSPDGEGPLGAQEARGYSFIRNISGHTYLKQDPNMDLPAGHARMLLSQPPIRWLQLSQLGSKQQLNISCSSGITIGELLRQTRFTVDKGEYIETALIECNDLRESRTVDDISGWEMLQMLSDRND